MTLLSSLLDPQLAATARAAGIDRCVSRSKQRGSDGVADQIEAWLAGTKWRRQERG